MDQNQKLKNRILAICSCLLLAISIFMVWLVNRNIPFMMDDLWYSTLLYSDEPIKNLSDIVKAQIWHYNNWGGRAMAHTLLQLILIAGERFADIANTIMVFLTGVIITFMSETVTKIRRNWSTRIAIISLIMGAIHGLNANWKMSMYWQAGAANYLYMTIFILLYLWCYIRELSAENIEGKNKLPGINIWIIPLAILAGWSNENMGPVSFVFSAATILWYYQKCRRIKAWMIEGAVITFVGSGLCILAPGNFVRNEQVAFNNYGTLWQAYLHAYSDFNGLFNYLFIAATVVVLLVAFFKAYGNSILGLPIVFLLVASVLSWGAMLLSPHYPDRAAYGTIVLLIVAGVSLIQKLVEANKKLRPYMYSLGMLIWCRGMFFLAEFMGIVWGWIR